MIGFVQGFLPLLGRILLSAIFLMSAIHKLTHWSATESQMQSEGLAWVSLLLAGAVAFELAGSLMVLVGFQARWGALLLFVFLIPVTFIVHDFWTYEGQEQQTQMINFIKNLAVMGGTLMVMAFGAGAFSVDAWRVARRREHPAVRAGAAQAVR
ncbi:MAG: DoxX family protein [Planctomycetales bacterium]|nr:DoxX family protein [Planctomycetales bacterium]